MDPSHKLYIAIQIEESNLKKIGQYPSVADLSIPSLKKYEKVLDDNLISELKRGIGLHAHGIGAGSYLYLRRVFEQLVLDAETTAVTDDPSLKEKLTSSRMSEKLKLLKDYLPPFLASNDIVYKVLSKGVHELSEQECNEYFDVLLKSILLILDEKKAEIDKKENENFILHNLNDISTQLK